MYEFRENVNEQVTLSNRTPDNKFYLVSSNDWNLPQMENAYRWFLEKLTFLMDEEPATSETVAQIVSGDDTMVPKSGTKFADVSKLFDHTEHNGSCYLNGHCFVSIMLCVLVWKQDKIAYLAVPLRYRMWQKNSQSLNWPHPWSVRLCLNFQKGNR